VQQGFAGELVATTELPHFSQWNWDVTRGAACTQLSIPSSVQLGAVRVIGTDSTNNIDTSVNAWTVNAQCLPPKGSGAGGYLTLCLGNSPSGGGGFGLGTTFKYQAKAINGNTWCDLQVAVKGGVAKTALSGQDFNDWLAIYGYNDINAFCGNPPPTGVIKGTIDLGNPVASAPKNKVVVLATSGSCPGIGDLSPYNSGVAPGRDLDTFNVVGGGDPGFAAMRANVLNPTATINQDFDRDGKAEGVDNCPANSSSQVDTNKNGIGDACESWCNIPLSDPFSTFYDFDQDGIDDSCDNNYTVFNPSQYIPTF
jgi:Thrombospondin type 3 repeat